MDEDNQEQSPIFVNNPEQVPRFNNNQEQIKEAPIGVKIISIFYYLQVALVVIAGILIVSDFFKNSLIAGYGSSFLTLVIPIILLIALSVFVFLIAHGLWKGKSWTRIIVIIFSVWELIIGLGLIIGLSGIAIMKNILTSLAAILINGVIGGYLLFNERVNEFFKESLPLGVQIISMWCYIWVFISALLGITCLIGAGIIGALIPSLAELGSALFIIAAVFLIVIGIVNFFIGRGLRRVKNGARIITIIFAILVVLIGIYSLISSFTFGTSSSVSTYTSAISKYLIFGDVIAVLIYGFIGGYLLFSNKVKEAFNKSFASNPNNL
jgi:hypothetical protein